MTSNNFPSPAWSQHTLLLTVVFKEGSSTFSAQIYSSLWNATTEESTQKIPTAHTEKQHWHFSKHVPTGTSEPIITCLRAVLQIELEVIFVYLGVGHCSLDSRVFLHGLHPVLELWGVAQRATGKRRRLSNTNGKKEGHQRSKIAWEVLFYCLFCFLPV